MAHAAHGEDDFIDWYVKGRFACGLDKTMVRNYATTTAAKPPAISRLKVRVACTERTDYC